jgi:hypothetical protein
MLKKLFLATALFGLVLSGVGVSAAPDASDAASSSKFITAQTTDQWACSKVIRTSESGHRSVSVALVALT